MLRSLLAFRGVALYIAERLHAWTCKTAVACGVGGICARRSMAQSWPGREGACIFKPCNPERTAGKRAERNRAGKKTKGN